MKVLDVVVMQGLLRERACYSHSGSIDGEIKVLLKIVTQKLGHLVYWGYWGSILRIQKFP